ncbi:MAG TPA: thioredoxin-disulfide reductase [bacterium]|nr:thioredoxin-disulfide reductase [bacterium]
MEKNVLIIGGGPAGLTAGMYSARARIKTAVIEKLYAGGNMLITEKIENYPGFEESISGTELSERMKKQYLNWGGELLEGEAAEVSFEGRNKIVKLSDGREMNAGALIIASGSSRQKLGVEGEDRFLGRGVSYCAICDGAFFRNKKIAVVGGGNSALEEAIYLTRYASVCYLVHRRNEFRASKHFQEEILKYPSIKPVLSAVVEKIKGGESVRSIILKRLDKNITENLDVDGIFISVGQKPNVDFIKGKIEQNPSGYIMTDYKMQTSEKGVFACGDVVRKSLYQVVTACGEGATAATSAEKYLEGLE